jgi:hypothetical protein
MRDCRAENRKRKKLRNGFENKKRRKIIKRRTKEGKGVWPEQRERREKERRERD